MKSIIDNIVEQFHEYVGIWINQIISYLPGVLLSVGLLFASVWLSRWLKKKTKSLADNYVKDESIASLLSTMVSSMTLLGALVVILMILDLDEALTSILATAGVVGLAVGMALQDPMINTFSGIAMSIRNFYNIGDWISTNGTDGQIKDIKLRWTELQKPSGERIFIPNKMIVSNPVENYSIAGRRQIQIDCGIAYDSSLTKVKQIAIDTIVRNFDYVKKEEDVVFFFHNFGDSSIDFTLRFWIETKSMLEYKMNKSHAIIALKNAFDKNDISIPFPTRTLDIDWSVAENESSDAYMPPKRNNKPRRSVPNKNPFWNQTFNQIKS